MEVISSWVSTVSLNVCVGYRERTTNSVCFSKRFMLFNTNVLSQETWPVRVVNSMIRPESGTLKCSPSEQLLFLIDVFIYGSTVMDLQWYGRQLIYIVIVTHQYSKKTSRICPANPGKWPKNDFREAVSVVKILRDINHKGNSLHWRQRFHFIYSPWLFFWHFEYEFHGTL